MNAKTDNILTESRPLIDTIVILSAEIESLREENKSLRDQIREENKDHRALLSQRNVLMDAEIEELIAARREEVSMDKNRAEAYWHVIEQRDEARREVCEMIARKRRKTGIRGQTVGLDRVTPAEIAKEKGWEYLFDDGKSDSDPATGVQYGDLT